MARRLTGWLLLGLPVVIAACNGCSSDAPAAKTAPDHPVVPTDPRAAEIAAVLASADEPLLRARPDLVAGKYARMADHAYAFFRGSLALYRHDWEKGSYGLGSKTFSLAGPGAPAGLPLPLSLGDPHPENFGTLRARDGSLALEPNDFDSADRADYLWDVRRLAAGVSLAARESNRDDHKARDKAADKSLAIAQAAVAAYAAAIAELASGAAPQRIAGSEDELILKDMLGRSGRGDQTRRELDQLTQVDDGGRRLRRGILSDKEPTHLFEDLPAPDRAALPEAIARYRETLIAPPAPAYFTLLDAARELGVGVASWPLVRVILLVRGASDDPSDDVVLELKELPRPGLPASRAPAPAFADDRARVLATTRAAWALPDADPLWGATTWMGLPCQVRTESEGQKTFRVSRLEGKRGKADAIATFAGTLGRLLARVHASPLLEGEHPAARIAQAMGADPSAFVEEQARLGDAYAAEVLHDHELFKRDLEELGPRLGGPAGMDDGARTSASPAPSAGAEEALRRAAAALRRGPVPSR